MFQRTGSYLRGPLVKFSTKKKKQKTRGVICSSVGNHAQGVALAARIHGIPAVVVMAENATPSKIAATRAYGAEAALHGDDLGWRRTTRRWSSRTGGMTHTPRIT